MLVSTFVKKPPNMNENLNNYIKQSNDAFIKLFLKMSEERNKNRQIFGLDNSPLPPPIKKDILISGIFFLSLSASLYYFYSNKR